MKRTPLLNRHLSAMVYEFGHLDEVVVADAGLPCPPGVSVIDLAVGPNLPTLFQVLEVLKTELIVEQMVHATEANSTWLSALRDTCIAWEAEQGKPIDIRAESHAALKKQSSTARAIIRTGDFTPYANVTLISGVPF